jgi:hypothetical protein
VDPVLTLRRLIGQTGKLRLDEAETVGCARHVEVYMDYRWWESRGEMGARLEGGGVASSHGAVKTAPHGCKAREKSSQGDFKSQDQSISPSSHQPTRSGWRRSGFRQPAFKPRPPLHLVGQPSVWPALYLSEPP